MTASCYPYPIWSQIVYRPIPLIRNKTLAIAAVVLSVSVVAILSLITLGPGLFALSRDHQPSTYTPDTQTSGSQPGERWIDVDRTTGTVTLHAGSTIVAQYAARVGGDPSPDGFYATALGTFHVYSMSADLAPTSFYDGGYLTEWVGFDPERYNGFHSPVRDSFGVPFPHQNPTTKGCVRLSEDDARAVYAFAFMGMRVEVHE
jgi:hypothetical protein